MLNFMMTIIAHQGNASEAPENTLPAFRQAIDLNVDFVECDIQLSKDGIPVLLHDGTLGRTTDIQTDASVDTLTLEEIKNLDAGSWFHQDFAGEPIPALEELLALPRPSSGLMLDIKEETYNDGKLLTAILDVLARYPQKLPLLFGTLNPHILRDLQDQFPPARLIATIETEQDWKAFQPIKVHTCALDYHIATPDRIAQLHKSGNAVWAWTVDDPKVFQKLQLMKIEGIITNAPKAARKWARQ